MAETSDGIEYTIESGTVTITGYKGSATSLDLSNRRVDGHVITRIGNSAFEGNEGLRSISFPSTLLSIGSSAFEGCANIGSLVFPESLTRIDYNAFRNCTSLTSITVNSRSFSVGYEGVFANAGSGASGISVTFGPTCDTIPDNLFRQQYANYGNAAHVTSVVIGSKVSEIGSSAFEGCSSLVSVRLGNNVTKIDSYAFSGCSSLKPFSFPTTLLRIEDRAFEGCIAWNTLSLPESLVYIGSNAFRNCTSLNSVNVASRDLGVYYEGIFANAGSGTSGITVSFASTCSKVPDNFFRQYSSSSGGVAKVSRVSVAAGVSEVGAAAFQGCSELKSVSLGSGVTKIDSYAFQGCSSLPAFDFPATLQRIEAYAFEDCAKWGKLTLPKSLVYLGRNAFRNCTSLTSITVNSANLSVYYEGVFANAGSGASGIKVSFTSTCSKVPDYFFRQSSTGYGGVANVSSVSVSSGPSEIGKAAFQGCASLKKVSLPKSIKVIGEYAFCDCTSLKSLLLPHNIPANDVGYRAYLNMGLDGTLTVTTGEQYKKIKDNGDYVTTTRTKVVLASNSLYRASASYIYGQAYTGKSITPIPTVKMGSKTLTYGTDFTISYKDNVALGKASVKIKGKGSYVGAKRMTFKIIPAKLTGVKAVAYSGSYVKVTWSNKVPRKAGVDGYRLYYKQSGASAQYLYPSWSSSEQFIYNLTKGKSVTVKVQAYEEIDGRRFYGAWSTSKTVRVKS